jgi:tripartite-type tricarboxylate transporter receptor subunit TctC
LASAPFAIIAHPTERVNSPREFVEVLKTEKVNISAGAGSRLVYEELQSRTHFPQGRDGVMRIEHKGPVDQLIDVAGSNVRFGIVPINVAAEFYKDHRIKIIALTGARRIEQFPELPVLDAALPGFDIVGNWGIALPAGTPNDVVEWYTREFVRALRSPSVQALLKSQMFNANPELQSTAKFTQYMQARDREWQVLIDSALKH